MHQLYEGSFINIKGNIFSPSTNQGSIGDSGSSGSNPNPTPGQEVMNEPEVKKKNKKPLTGIVHHMQYYYDPVKKSRIYPEFLHFNGFFVMPTKDNPVRKYAYRNMVYTHDMSSSDPSKHFCLVEYDDGSTCTIYDIATIGAHIELHKLNY
jgi:hypothetical protein